MIHRRSLVALLLLSLVVIPACQTSTAVRVDSASWGEVSGEPIFLYTMKNDAGTTVRVTNYGAIVTELHLRDRNGTTRDVVLGFDSLEAYAAGHPYFGCIAGRVANRIAGGRFTLDGETYQLATNNGPNHLHGGERGFDKRVWKATPTETAAGAGVELRYRSADGEEGYPGNVDVVVTYILTDDNELEVTMEARADEATPVNLVHHSYWNLAGHDSGTVLEHELELECARYTPTDGTLIPTGASAPVDGTPFDFTEPAVIGEKIGSLRADKDGGHGGGYDLNLIVDGRKDGFRDVARLHHPDTGITLRIRADKPGVQFYTGNFLDGSVKGKGGQVYRQYQGLCLETQHYPDSINQPAFPSVVLRPGEVYRHRMVHAFSVE